MRGRRHPQQQIITGLILAFVGVLFLLDNFNVLDAGSVLAFWPMVLIAIGILKLTQSQHPSGYVVGAALVGAGVLLTLQHMGLLTLRWRDWWPVLLIALGVMVIVKGQWGPTRGPGEDGAERGTLHDSHMELTTVMSGSELQMDTQDFRGGDLTVVMGGVELDLRKASITSEATLHVFVAMGGVDIRIPTDWSVIVNGVPLMAAIEDKSVPPANPVKRLTLTGYLIMGAIEIKN